MWETAAFVLAIIGGYVFSLRCKITRLAILKSSGHALFYRAAFWGYIHFQASCLILLIFRSDPDLSSFFIFWLSPFDHSAATAAWTTMVDSVSVFEGDLLAPSLLAMWLGLFLWIPTNLVLGAFMPQRVLVARLVQEYGTDLEKTLMTSLAEFRMLLITLDTGKVYAGWVVRTPNLDFDNQDPGAGFDLLTFMSGYRESPTMKVVFTTDYTWIYEEDHGSPEKANTDAAADGAPSDEGGAAAESPTGTPAAPEADEAEPLHQLTVDELVTFIPIRRIVSTTFFDPALFDEFQRRTMPTSLTRA